MNTQLISSVCIYTLPSMCMSWVSFPLCRRLKPIMFKNVRILGGFLSLFLFYSNCFFVLFWWFFSSFRHHLHCLWQQVTHPSQHPEWHLWFLYKMKNELRKERDVNCNQKQLSIWEWAEHKNNQVRRLWRKLVRVLLDDFWHLLVKDWSYLLNPWLLKVCRDEENFRKKFHMKFHMKSHL